VGLDTQERQNIKYFIGTEVEHTAMKGKKTLFVVGIQPVEEIKRFANGNGIEHLYFGTSQSFNPRGHSDFVEWENMIFPLLDEGYWCTLDFDAKYAESVLESGYDESDKFIAMISVKIPYIRQFNYNATVKIDDNTWGFSNSGVWCHSLHNLMNRQVYTDWSEYQSDTPLN
jgi:hypothetical protein